MAQPGPISRGHGWPSAGGTHLGAHGGHRWWSTDAQGAQETKYGHEGNWPGAGKGFFQWDREYLISCIYTYNVYIYIIYV